MTRVTFFLILANLPWIFGNAPKSYQRFIETSVSPKTHVLKYTWILRDWSRTDFLLSKAFSAEGTPVSDIKLQIKWHRQNSRQYSNDRSYITLMASKDREYGTSVVYGGTVKMTMNNLQGDNMYFDVKNDVARFPSENLIQAEDVSYNSWGNEPINTTFVIDVDAEISEPHESFNDTLQNHTLLASKPSLCDPEFVKMDLKYSNTFFTFGDNERMKVSRAVLAARSKKFEEIFDNYTKTDESQDIVIDLRELVTTQVTPAVLRHLVEVCEYGRGSQNLLIEEKLLWIQLTREFKLPELEKYAKVLWKQDLNAWNAEEMLKIAEKLNDTEMKHYVLSFMRARNLALELEEWYQERKHACNASNAFGV